MDLTSPNRRLWRPYPTTSVSTFKRGQPRRVPSLLAPLLSKTKKNSALRWLTCKLRFPVSALALSLHLSSSSRRPMAQDDPVVSAQWLQQHLGQPDIKVKECFPFRFRRIYHLLFRQCFRKQQQQHVLDFSSSSVFVPIMWRTLQ